MVNFENPERVPGISEFIPEKVIVTVLDVDDTVTRGTQKIKQESWPILFPEKPDLLKEALDMYESTGAGDRYNIIAHVIGVEQDECLNSPEVAQYVSQFEELTMLKIREGGIHPDDVQALVSLRQNFPGRIYLVSATPEAVVRGNINHFEEIYPELKGMFANVIGTPMKSGKAGELIKIANTHGLALNEVLMVGDGGSDYLGAEKSGSQFVGVVPGNEINHKWAHKSFPIVQFISELPGCLKL